MHYYCEETVMSTRITNTHHETHHCQTMPFPDSTCNDITCSDSSLTGKYAGVYVRSLLKVYSKSGGGEMMIAILRSIYLKIYNVSHVYFDNDSVYSLW
jgi:hypothetical protein